MTEKDKIMNYFLICVTMTACLVFELLKKFYTKHAGDSVFYQYIFVTAMSFVALAVLCCFGFEKTSFFTVWLGIAFGTATFIQTAVYLSAVKCGPLSFTSIVTAFSTVIPVLAGSVVWGEKIKSLQIAGIVLMAISIVLSVLKNEKDKGFSKKWFLFAIILFLVTGSIGVMQKVHQKSDYAVESGSFLITAFICAFVLSGIISLIMLKRENVTFEKGKSLLILLIVVAVCGICSAFNNKLNLYLSGVINSAVLFPLLNGGGAVLTITFSVIIFKERLSLRQWIGVVLGIGAIVLLCLN